MHTRLHLPSLTTQALLVLIHSSSLIMTPMRRFPTISLPRCIPTPHTLLFIISSIPPSSLTPNSNPNNPSSNPSNNSLILIR